MIITLFMWVVLVVMMPTAVRPTPRVPIAWGPTAVVPSPGVPSSGVPSSGVTVMPAAVVRTCNIPKNFPRAASRRRKLRTLADDTRSQVVTLDIRLCASILDGTEGVSVQLSD